MASHRAAGQVRGMTRSLCHIKVALDKVEACPQGACPFWEHGGAVIESGCRLERLSLELDNRHIAAYLAELRERLETARNDEERAAAQQAFAQLVPPEFSGR